MGLFGFLQRNTAEQEEMPVFTKAEKEYILWEKLPWSFQESENKNTRGYLQS